MKIPLCIEISDKEFAALVAASVGLSLKHITTRLESMQLQITALKASTDALVAKVGEVVLVNDTLVGLANQLKTLLDGAIAGTLTDDDRAALTAIQTGLSDATTTLQGVAQKDSDAVQVDAPGN